MDRILALDVATRTGWATDSADCRGCGTIDLSVGVPKRGRHPGLILLHARRDLGELVARTRPDLVVFERPFARGSGTRLLMALAGIVELVAAEHGLATLEVGISQARKAATGRPTLTKPEAVAWAEAAGWSPPDDNAADAVIVLAAYRTLIMAWHSRMRAA